MKREWPLDWSERVRGKECPMCAEGRPDVAYGNSRIFKGRVSDAYLVRIELHANEVGRGDLRGPVKLGLGGTAEIVTGQESVLSILLNRIRQTISLG